MRLAVLLSSVRPGRMSERVGKYLESYAKSRGVEVDVIDPAKLNLPMFDKKLAFYPPGDASIPKDVADVSKRLIKSDAFIICSAEYNHTIPPALSNLMCFFWSEYERKPSGIVTYSMGPFGGVRAAMALRPMLAELKTPSIPTLLPIPVVQNVLNENGDFADGAAGPSEKIMKESTDKFFNELLWYAGALKVAREK